MSDEILPCLSLSLISIDHLAAHPALPRLAHRLLLRLALRPLHPLQRLSRWRYYKLSFFPFVIVHSFGFSLWFLMVFSMVSYGFLYGFLWFCLWFPVVFFDRFFDGVFLKFLWFSPFGFLDGFQYHFQWSFFMSFPMRFSMKFSRFLYRVLFFPPFFLSFAFEHLAALLPVTYTL